MNQGSSNIDDVEAWLEGIIAGIDFTRAGAEESLGRDLAGAVAEGIRDRSLPDARAPDGGEWTENRDPYKTWKAKKYDAYQPGILTGQMLSLESLLGETEVAAENVQMRYGTGKPADRALNGQPPPKAKEPATDREKATYFTESGREFYALDDAIADKAMKVAEEALPKIVDELARGS